MAYYWLSACELGKTMIAISDLMRSPGSRKFNYFLRLFCDPVKENAKKFFGEAIENNRSSYILQRCSLESLIKVYLKNAFSF